MSRTRIKIERIEYTQFSKEVEVELPDETSFYFFTGIRRSYKVIPKFQNWEGGNGNVFAYEIIEVGLSFECIAQKTSFIVNDIPGILKTESHKLHNLVRCMVDNDKSGIRTEEQFNADLNAALESFKI